MLNLSILTQPDCISCGPTCLQAIYHYFEDKINLEQVIKEVPYLESGGTLAILLGCHALSRGYQADLYSFNLHVLDPTWFKKKSVLIREKLYEQLNHASHQKMHLTTQAYLQFLDLGGRIHFSEMNFDLIRQQVDQNTPLISGLSATYLYQTMRDYTNKEDRVVYDEWLGAPSGHFVVIRGYEANPNTLHIADPYSPHPLSREHYYSISFSHWLHAFLLGIMTYDAELLVIKPAV